MLAVGPLAMLVLALADTGRGRLFAVTALLGATLPRSAIIKRHDGSEDIVIVDRGNGRGVSGIGGTAHEIAREMLWTDAKFAQFSFSGGGFIRALVGSAQFDGSAQP